MSHVLLQHLVELDRHFLEASAALRWGPATAFFVLMSAAWVKGPLFIVIGFLRDLKHRALPLTAAAVALALYAGDRASTGIKAIVERPRPPHPGGGVDTEALVQAPSTPSFPSGHATTAFATAVVIAILVPKLRWPSLIIAALVAISRPYLGVHFWLDILAGALLGSLVGAAIARSALALARVHWRKPRRPQRPERRSADPQPSAA